MSVDAGDALKFLNLVGELYASSRKRYAEARKLAEQAGLSQEDRDAADARYGFTYLPPPPGWTGGTTPPDPDPPTPPVPPDLGEYEKVLDYRPKREDYPAGGVLWQADYEVHAPGHSGMASRWMVKQKVGIGKPQPPWREVEWEETP